MGRMGDGSPQTQVHIPLGSGFTRVPHLRGGRGWLPHFPPGFGFRCLSERFLKLLVWVLYFISSQGLPPPTKTEVKAWLDGFCGREN